MRRLIAALIALAVALTLAGCGGGDPEPAASDTPTDAAPEAPAAAPAATEDREDDSPLVGGYPKPFPTDAQIVPEEILERIETGQPLFIYYYDDEHDVVDDLDEQIDAVLDEYRGLIYKIEYGISDDIEDVVEDGESLGEGLTEEEQAELKRVYRLAEELEIMSTPFIILVDREGTITWMHRGYVDQETLELKVLYATQ